MGSVNPNDYQEKCLIRIDSVDHFRILGYGTIDGAGWSGLRKNGAREFYLVYASNCKDIVLMVLYFAILLLEYSCVSFRAGTF